MVPPFLKGYIMKLNLFKIINILVLLNICAAKSYTTSSVTDLSKHPQQREIFNNCEFVHLSEKFDHKTLIEFWPSLQEKLHNLEINRDNFMDACAAKITHKRYVEIELAFREMAGVSYTLSSFFEYLNSQLENKDVTISQVLMMIANINFSRCASYCRQIDALITKIESLVPEVKIPDLTDTRDAVKYMEYKFMEHTWPHNVLNIKQVKQALP